MAAVSAVFILDARGRVLIYRDYRGDVTPRHAERFMARLAEAQQGGIDGGGDPSSAAARSPPPVLHDDGVSYVHLPHSDVHLLAVSRGNANAAAAVVFLRHLVGVFRHYFGEVEEESVRDNFVTVYELLDEVMDHGWPQFTEARILSEYIKTDAHRLLEPLGISAESQARPPMAVTNAVSWRSEGVRHKKNEVFLDVVESVSMVVGTGGQVVVSEVQGTLKMRTYLSGMPECKLGLNDKVLFEAQGRAGRQRAVDLEDAKFHQCVRLARFDNDRTIR
jgi:AP-1 complex subunit mu